MLAFISTLLASVRGEAAWQPAFDETLGAGERGNIQIADPGVALTFARARMDGELRLVAVTAYRGSIVEAVDLSVACAADASDPATLFLERGYDALAHDVAHAPDRARIEIPVESLALPLELGRHHVAVGTNYPEHASDAGTVRPFLFPKLVVPTPSGSDVAVHGGLLDYEIEIAIVPLEPLSDAAPAFLGVILANDFTDRETLMHSVDRRDIESGRGFTTGKSFPGYLPVGNLFVIPRRWRDFVHTLELRLYVNGALRQSSPATDMVWNVEEILARTLEARGRRWQHRGADVPLFAAGPAARAQTDVTGEVVGEPDGAQDDVAARTLFLTGTPHGTVFGGVPMPVIVSGILRWAAGVFRGGVADHVVAAYIRSARDAHVYLEPGDEVLARVPFLGEMTSRVVS